MQEVFYPLHAYVCLNCFLVQLAEFEPPEAIFSDYLYFSSYSDSWLEHAEQYVSDVIKRFHLTTRSRVIEIASNDGYLLQYFQGAGIPCLGIDPAKNVAAVAQEQGINTLVAFFGTALANELTASRKHADLLIGNNVLAHVPDLNDFVAGMKIVLSRRGVITMEFPHLLELIEFNQFDTIYHEHFSYFSLLTVNRLFASHGLRVFDVGQLPTHGGSLRIYACHADYTGHRTTRRVPELIEIERASGLDHLAGYVAYPERVKRTKRALLKFLIDAQDRGLSTVAYGAPAKGNTLLNYCGIRGDLLEYTVDRSPHKQGRFLPGTHLPICAPDYVRETRPDYLLILSWNLRDEIIDDVSYIRDWGGKFVVPIPELAVVE
jgi:SAM-dependent methyltransferase